MSTFENDSFFNRVIYREISEKYAVLMCNLVFIYTPVLLGHHAIKEIILNTHELIGYADSEYDFVNNTW